MGRLMKYEFLKIIRRKSSFIMLIICLLINGYLFGVIALQERTYDENGKEYVGISAIEKEKQNYSIHGGLMTEEKVAEDILVYQKEFNNPNNVATVNGKGTVFFKDEVYWEFLCPQKEYYTLISENYNAPFEYGKFGSLPNIPVKNNDANFYRTRLEKINKLLDQDYLDANYTSAEKKYWLSMNDKVNEPFYFSFAKGWINIINSSGLWLFVILGICVCIAPVFANEYQTGMDSLICSAKYGKSKVIGAKILASFIYGSIVFIINVSISLAAVLIPFGIDGWDLQVQIMDTIIPYPLNFLQATVLYIIIAYVIVLAFISLNLLLSALMSSPYPILVIDAILLIMPSFMSYSDKNPVYNHVFPLLPTKALEMSLTYYTDYKIGILVFSWPAMIVLVYFLITVVLLPFVYKIFKSHQIQ